MAPLPPLPNVSRVVLNWTWQGQRCATVLHYRSATGEGGPDATDIGPRIEASFNSAITSFISNTCSLDSITVSPLDPNPPETTTYTTNLPRSGGDTSPSMPNQVTCTITHRTGIRGRSYRGRTYILGLTEAAITGNTIAGIYRDAWLGWFNNLRILEPGTGEVEYRMVVASYRNAGAPRPTPVATPITAFSTDGIVDTQRRRLPGR